jgi:hypothetical protein
MHQLPLVTIIAVILLIALFTLRKLCNKAASTVKGDGVAARMRSAAVEPSTYNHVITRNMQPLGASEMYFTDRTKELRGANFVDSTPDISRENSRPNTLPVQPYLLELGQGVPFGGGSGRLDWMGQAYDMAGTVKTPKKDAYGAPPLEDADAQIS